MHHIQRIGYISQELTNPVRISVGNFAGGSPVNDQREKQGETNRIVQTVHPQAIGSAQARNGQQNNHEQAALPKGPPDTGRPENAGQKQPGGESVQQTKKSSRKLRPGQRKPGANIAVRPEDAKSGQAASGRDDQYRKGLRRKFTDNQSIQNIADIFEKQRPARPVQRIHLPQAPNFGAGRSRDQQRIDERGQQQGRDRHLRNVPHRTSLEIKHDRPNHSPHDDHRVKAYDPAFDEILHGHRFPAVVVSIANDKTGQNKEEIDSQITVVDLLIQMTRRIGFEYMKPYDHNGGHAAQSVEDHVMRFRVSESRGRYRCFRHE